jgi:hypothetical protein
VRREEKRGEEGGEEKVRREEKRGEEGGEERTVEEQKEGRRRERRKKRIREDEL